MFPTTKDEAAAYLAAMIDGEGSVYAPEWKTSNRRQVCISNTDWDIICATTRCCDVLGVPYRLDVRLKNGNGILPIHRVRIGTTAAIATLAATVPVQCKRKMEGLRRAAIPAPPRGLPIAAEELKRLYWDEDVPVVEIAKAYGVKKATVYSWFYKLGVPRRPMAEVKRRLWANATAEEKAEKVRQLHLGRYG